MKKISSKQRKTYKQISPSTKTVIFFAFVPRLRRNNSKFYEGREHREEFIFLTCMQSFRVKLQKS